MAKSKKTVVKSTKKAASKKPAAKKATSKKSGNPAVVKSKPASKKVVKPAIKKAPKPVKLERVKKAAVKKVVKVLPAKKAVVKKKTIASTPSKNVVRTTDKFKPAVVNAKKGNTAVLKTRYSDSELEEFRQLILEKYEAAKKELKYLQEQISRTGENATEETENKYSSVDDGGSSMEREYLNQMASRQRLYIDHLDKALVRIQNKTYGICRVTGKLIEKDRLRAVPHATLSMEAKMIQGHPQQTPTT